MKPNFKTIGYLIAFVIGGAIFQISCSNSDDSDPEPIPPVTAEKVVYMQIHNQNAAVSLWACNADGTNHAQVPITLPTGFVLLGPNAGGNNGHVTFSSDGQRLRFTAVYTADHSSHLYSCNLDGSDLIHLGSWTADTVYLN